MRFVFAHDHPFRLVNGKLYSTGSLSNDVLSRYANYCDELIVIARIRPEDNANDRWSLISNSKVIIRGKRRVSLVGLKDEIKKADKVIVRLPSLLGLASVWYAKRYHKPYYVEVVGCIWDALWNHSLKGKMIAPIMYILNKTAIRNSKYVLYVTKYFLQKRYPTKGFSIGCSDVELLEIDESVLENRIRHIQNKKKNIVIGTIGAVDVRYKGQEYVIKAISKLDNMSDTNYIYQIVGNGNQEYLKRMAQQYRVDDKVMFLGGMPHEKIFEWMDSIDIYIQPSLTEGLPRSVIEAMSRGVPTIGSDVGGIPELLDIDDLVKKGDSEEIKDKLAKLTQSLMISKARRNFDNSKYYQKEILDARRNGFFERFLADI